MYCVARRRRNAVESEPDIALDLVDDATFKKALAEMGFAEEDIPVYARASGQSPRILRRRLSEVPAIKLGEAAYVIGWLMATGVVTGLDGEEFLYHLVSEGPERSPAHIDVCVSGFLVRTDDAAREALLSNLLARFAAEGAAGQDKSVRLLKCAPFRRQTWQHVDRLSPALQAKYWSEVNPHWGRQEPDELHEIIDRLLKVNRPRAALSAVHFEFKKIESRSLVRLLKDVATNDAEPAGHYRFDSYTIGEAFKVLDDRADIPRDELAHLEFMYLAALDHEERGIPNLERQIAESPELFMQAIALSYKRNDDGEDPPEWRLKDSGPERSIATQAYRLLHIAKRIPGTQDDGTFDVKALKAWITDVRALCKTYARVDVGDSAIGELLSKSPAGADGIWPCEPVRQVLEEVGTKKIAEGMAIGLYNQRGAHFRDVGGKKERELSAKYRGWSKQIAFESPFTSRLLERLAQSYDRDAEWHDTEANLRKRLPY